MEDQQQGQPQENVVRDGGLDLPTGFRFHPTDYELVNHYLTKKVHNRDFTCAAIGEVDLNKTMPWDLPMMEKMGEKEWYFFCHKDRKYPTGLTVNRATETGYWKAIGKDKEVYKPNEGEGVTLLVGMKKTLVFYKGRAPRGDKTNWVMHEYRLQGSDRFPCPTSASSTATNSAAMKDSTYASKDDWVVCRVFQKTIGIKKTTAPAYQEPMAATEIGHNQNNFPFIPIPMPLPIPMVMPIFPDFAIDLVAPYYPNPNAAMGMPPMMPPMEEDIGGANGILINGAMFGYPMVPPPPMNFYHQIDMGVRAGQIGIVVAGQLDMGAMDGQMGMGAVGQMDMGVAGADGFDVAASDSRPSSTVSQNDEQANAAEVSSMMSVTGPGSPTTTLEMDGIWKYE